MFDSKSPLIKYTGYAIIGFFGLIIIISFGMPSFMPEITRDKNAIAVINGEKIKTYDFLRYRDSRNRNLKDDKEMERLLDEYIQSRLLLQQAKKMGFEASDTRVARDLKKYPFLQDKDGKFDPKKFNTYLENTWLTIDKFYLLHKNDYIRRDFMDFVMMGVSVSPADLKSEYVSDNSKIQIKYSFISNPDLKKKFKAQLEVKEDEISKEMAKNKSEVKDPKTDKIRIKKKLETNKLNKLKKELADKINAIALRGGQFTQTSALLGGKVGLSNQFKIGGYVKENTKKGRPLTTLSNSKIFQENCLKLPVGVSSRTIEAATGMYVFTPILKDIKKTEPTEKDLESLRKMSENQTSYSIYNKIMSKFYEDSKIIKNFKPNK